VNDDSFEWVPASCISQFATSSKVVAAISNALAVGGGSASGRH
jgi:hypothetical protein